MKRTFCSFILFVILCIHAAGADNELGGQMPDPSQGGGFTDDFTTETFQQTFVYSQPVYTNPVSSSWGAAGQTYTTQRPADYGQLIDTGTVQGSGGQSFPTGNQPALNGIWIVDATGLNRYPEMSVPLYGYVQEELTPSVEGPLTIEEMYPNGEIRTYSMGYVQPYHVYKMWFYGDVPGTHLIRYNVNGYYSNVIRFYVQGSGPAQAQGANQGWGTPATTGSSMITRAGNRIVRSSGGVTHSSMSSSGGSISVSMSVG